MTTFPLPVVTIGNFDPQAVPAVVEGFEARARNWEQDPLNFVHDTFIQAPSGGTIYIDPEQARILRAVAAFDRVAVRTGRGVGKTASAALIVHWWLSTRYPALVVTSAGTWGHLEDKLWPEIRLWGREWILRDGYEYQQMGIFSTDNPEALRAVATSSDRPVNVEGFHSKHLLLLIDEAKGMADEIYAALLASLTSEEEGSEQKVVALSTPPLSRQGWFARVSSSTEWKVIHVSGLDSTRVSPAYVKEIAETFGEESPEYQSYVLGEIPEGTSEAVIPLKWFEQCQALAPCSPKKNTRPPVITCDVAREGDDLTTIGVFDRAAFSLVKFEDRYGWFAHLAITETIGRCIEAAKLHPHAAAICIDDTGLGGGVTDGLREAQTKGKFPSTISIMAVKFGGKASQYDRFDKKKDELWWSGRLVIQQHRLSLPTDDEIRLWRCPRGSDFKNQMTSAIFTYDSTDQIVVLDKRVAHNERTKTLPTKSPDLAHAFILGVRYYMRQTELPEPPEPPKDSGESLHRRVQEEVRRVIDQNTLSSVYGSDPYRRRR